MKCLLKIGFLLITLFLTACDVETTHSLCTGRELLKIDGLEGQFNRYKKINSDKEAFDTEVLVTLQEDNSYYLKVGVGENAASFHLDICEIGNKKVASVISLDSNPDENEGYIPFLYKKFEDRMYLLLVDIKEEDLITNNVPFYKISTVQDIDRLMITNEDPEENQKISNTMIATGNYFVISPKLAIESLPVKLELLKQD